MKPIKLFTELKKIREKIKKNIDVSIEINTLKQKLQDAGVDSNLVESQLNLLYPHTQSAVALNFEEELLQAVPNANLLQYQPTVYQTLLPYAKLLYSLENNGIAEEHAYKLSLIFENADNALKYLENFAKANPKNLTFMHDANLFTLPENNIDLAIWRKLCMKYLHEPDFRTKILPQAAELEALIKNEALKRGKQLPKVKPSQIIAEAVMAAKEIEKTNTELKALRTKSFKKRLTPEEKKHMEELVSTLSDQRIALSNIGISFSDQLSLTALQAFFERNFIDTSDSYRYFCQHGLNKKDFALFLSLNRNNDDQKIPNITIDGKELGMRGLYLMKVDVMDELQAARAACLGKITDCCQSLSGEAGQPCVIHGLTSPNSGFYIVCQGDVNNPKIDDPVLGQCWAWRSQNDAIVFDSIESVDKGDLFLTEQIHYFYRDLGKRLVEEGHTHKVACGASSGISQSVGTISVSNPEHFVDYSGYCDSRRQRVIFDKHDPFYAFAWDEKSTEATLDKIISILQNPLPLGQSEDFCKIINWAILSGKLELDNIKQMAKTCNRLAEVEALISTIESIIHKNLNTIMLNIEENETLVNIVNQDSDTVLIHMISLGHSDLCLKLIEKGADVNATSNNGRTTLVLAASLGLSDLCLKLIEKGADINDATNSNGNTALMEAAIQGHSDLCLKLIEKSADVNIVNNYGQTVLIQAALQGHSNLCLKLIEKGTNISAANFFGDTALMEAASHGLSDVCLKLIEKGASINAIDNQGKTALIRAAFSKNSDVCLKLIEKGADINLADNNRQTALIGAASHGLSDVCLKLLEKGANINAPDTYGQTALTRAITSKHSDLCLLLIEKGADVNTINNFGRTALMQAAANQLSDVCLKLIEKGAAKNAQPNTIASLKNLLGDTVFNEAIAYQECTDTLRSAMLNALSTEVSIQPVSIVETMEDRRKSILFTDSKGLDKKLKAEQLIEKLNNITDLAELVSTWEEIAQSNSNFKLEETLLLNATSLLKSIEENQKTAKNKLSK